MAAMMMERGAMGMNMGMGGMAAGSTMPTGSQMMTVPRCTIMMEKCEGGMKMTCKADDKMSASMMQNLCTMMAGGMCSCCMMMNGMTICCCNMATDMCKCEMTDDGVCITCTSGDAECCKIIQTCCDCMTAMMASGCACCVSMNGMPACCSC
ncbi:hypothetical protein [Paludisphaera soli]|uniref:hypothetical protein n=1 Tax=Paludisphaera soli TaxID=2712865 RepID=UPI0013EB7290|nr:hypothetical protein [Paludisphaera soli]